MTSLHELETGDLIEIKYRMRRPGVDNAMFDRWVRAQIIDCDPEAWPLALLSDGQLTEVRPFMAWRAVPGGTRRAMRSEAA